MTIDTWDKFQAELVDQFYPENTEFIARTKLTTLQHKGSIREYVKEYTACMLDIKEMSEKDRLFNFVKGLKDWAQREVWRHKVTTLAEAITCAERFMDYNSERTPVQKKASNGPTTYSPRNSANGSQVSSIE